MRVFSLLWFKDKVCEYLKSVWLAYVFQAKIFRVKSTESERITSSPGSSFHLFIFKIILFVVVVVGKYFFFNFILFFNFTILYWFCHISKWIRHRYVYMCSPSWTLLPPPSLYHPFRILRRMCILNCSSEAYNLGKLLNHLLPCSSSVKSVQW